MKIGAFYQSGHKLVACYKAIEQFRKFYPDAPIALYEEGSDILKPVADKFNVNYTKVGQRGENSRHSGRPVVDLETNLAWLSRIYEACTTTLKDVDWIIHYEDDVWCKNLIKEEPKFDIAGANGPLYTPELYQYLKDRFNVTDESRGHWSINGSLQSYGGCGGAIFNRLSFIEAYNKLNEIPWDVVSKLDSRVVEWSDASLSFVFQHASLKSSIWNEWANYDSKGQGNWWDKTGWSVPMEEQPDVAILHLYKHYYNYQPGDIDLDL
jgi:hypothetical protein